MHISSNVYDGGMQLTMNQILEEDAYTRSSSEVMKVGTPVIRR